MNKELNLKDIAQEHVQESHDVNQSDSFLYKSEYEIAETVPENAVQEDEPQLPELVFNDTTKESLEKDKNESHSPFHKAEEVNSVKEVLNDESHLESAYEEEDDNADHVDEVSSLKKAVNIDSSFVDAQLEFLIHNEGILKEPEFLNASLNTKIYLISKILSKQDQMKLQNITFNTNQRRKRDLLTGQFDDHDNREPNPFDREVPSDELTQLYESYLEEESKGGREFYPRNSRLFIANLPLTNVTKKNLFQIFHIYGKILQINIKNNFGFIQYDSADPVLDAIKFESKRDNFGRKLVLEISNSTARPQYDHGDHGKNSSSTFVSSYKRYKNGELVKPRDNYSNEKSIHIIVKHQSDRNTANNLFDYLSRNRGWMISMNFLKPQEELKSAVKNAAKEQSNGCVIIKNYQNIDAIVFDKKMSGETVFNEYTNADRRDLIRLFSGGSSGYKNNRGHQQQQQQFPGMVTAHIPSIPSYPQPIPGMMPQQPYMPPMQQQPHPAINLGYNQGMPPQHMHMQQPAVHVPNQQDNSRTPQQQSNVLVDQSALLSQVQSLPPDVLKNLLANAQQQSSSSVSPPLPPHHEQDKNKDVLQLLNNLTKK
ncbi:hypothetical protein QEN19_000529 [Hanseniaspora menglaensis]